MIGWLNNNEGFTQATIAVALGVLAVVNYIESRRHSRAQLLPILSVANYEAKGNTRLAITLMNTGLGPAIGLRTRERTPRKTHCRLTIETTRSIKGLAPGGTVDVIAELQNVEILEPPPELDIEEDFLGIDVCRQIEFCYEDVYGRVGSVTIEFVVMVFKEFEALDSTTTIRVPGTEPTRTKARLDSYRRNAKRRKNNVTRRARQFVHDLGNFSREQ